MRFHCPILHFMPLLAWTCAQISDVPCADAYDWCTVPAQPWDVILFAGIAIVVSCVWQGSYQSLLVLISGECSCSDPSRGATGVLLRPSRRPN